ncbi:MAG: hypothetical protein VX727_04890 [Planctomycetota bacterium]|nr:hypothetical protein [Planctomycetota bacterium]
MKRLEPSRRDASPATSSLAGMLSTIACRLAADGAGWRLDLIGFPPEDIVDLINESNRTHGDGRCTAAPDGDVVSIRERSRDALLLVAGHVLRNHVRSRLDHRRPGLECPEVDFMHHLLARTGTFSIRRIETEVYSTWVDIGVSTRPDGSAKPADLSLIYDLVSNTWHTEF